MLTIRDVTFGDTFPFAPHYHEVNGIQLHYVDAGRGEPVLMVHGDPTWGYLYRRFIAPLAADHRCIVPDHMGMGKSSVPHTPYPYRLHHHIANLESLVLSLDLNEITLVLHDWGGPVGLGVAVRHAQRIKRLVLMNTWAFASWPGAPFPRLLQVIRSPRGEKFVLHKHGYLEPALLGTTLYPERLTATVLAAYHAPFPTPDSRRALLCWSRDIPVDVNDASFATMQQIELELHQFRNRPVLVLWGMHDPVLPATVLRRWQEVYPHAVTHAIDTASHFLQEDAPERILHHLETFLRHD